MLELGITQREVSVTLDKMGSTEYSIGLSDEKSSSRVLKPPGGGHSDIFGSPEVKANPPRPKYNQQNSSNMNGVMGTMDPNLKELYASIHRQPAKDK
ncbi:hypothetical protein pipiens_014925 [Culex pipiens pipiens]|uniref:Microtubule-associated protein Jupiter n=1 Tax=Culex pipiens pipiens TaxID=38569 RepID=A0ABD1CSN8_CULPP